MHHSAASCTVLLHVPPSYAVHIIFLSGLWKMPGLLLSTHPSRANSVFLFDTESPKQNVAHQKITSYALLRRLHPFLQGKNETQQYQYPDRP